MVASLLRIVATVVVLATAGGLAAGCANSSPASSGGVSTAFTKAQAIAYADAVNLRAGAVPGFLGGLLPHKREITHGPFGGAMERCDGGVVGGEVIGIISQGFTRDIARRAPPSAQLSLASDEEVQSAVFLTGSASLASREFAAIDSARARPCLKRLYEEETATKVRKGASAEKPLFSHVEISALRSPLRGVSVYGLRMTAPVALSGTKGHFIYYQDSFGFVIGPALITLSVAGYDPGVLPSATERRLLALLYQRAEAHKSLGF